MNIRISTTLLILIIVASPLLAHATESALKAVEIYPSGAAVTREVILQAGSGDFVSIELEGLPSSLMPSSVQISPLDDAGLRIGGFTFLPNENPVEPDDPRTIEEREALKTIDEQLRDIRLERQGIESRISHYTGMAESLRKSLSEKADTEAFDLAVKIWANVESVTQEGEVQLGDLTERESDLKIARRVAQKELDEKVDSLRKKAGVLRFDVRGDLQEGSRLALKYQVREAGWNPVYEIRAVPAKGTLEWIYKARIWQQSGEDWNGVAASLKSASALYSSGLPELPPLYLEHMEYRPMARKMMDSVSYAAGAPVEMEAMQQAEPESTTASFFIKLPESLTIASGKGPVVREAFTGSLKAEFWSEAAPQLSTDAWLMAGTTNDLGWPVLPGEAYAYIDGQLVSRKNLSGIPAGEDIEFALGKNEKIAIERHERKRKSSEGGLIDRTKRHEIKYETVVTNRMPVAHRVVLQDRFPVGRDNKIQVRIQSPKDVEPEEGTGLFKWERTLDPGAKGVLKTEYTVLYPAEWNIHPKP
ncbi:DUF4139 domain-containing protein [Puniceicoccales bacterium CK1056]|uniref:DUF4139 domain-containing protein n=1 Tax=Oceanipulchritudo coccoides TaxID=2706888 RepID=A0A6B2LZT5_9BACT|nr:DUF4139 domain-containing protein [Oceanipulchritudo coccoides]NDV61963.1 DUF4139 domain-containing protein [Oceanipulchritudo coccoides]